MHGMRIGYACVNTRLPSAARTVRLANATPERLRELIASNLAAQAAIFRWNVEHGVDVFRITSDLIPFGSHPVNTLAWWDEFAAELRGLAEIVAAEAMRLSMHPGQYTVLSSARPEVVDAAVADLVHHDRVLTALGVDTSHKVVIHVGSGAATADAADRFVAGVERLPDPARTRLVLENDERWPLADVLQLAERCALPVVLDVFHHELAPSLPGLGPRELVLLAAETWRDGDGRQEIHFSTQAPGRRPGAHAETVDLDVFARLVANVGDLPVDCILEVKDKEQSLLRARAALGTTNSR